ncbi:hypothetical protein C7M71_010625 [Peterkaempfera bronchialis]|uniref:Uncharacterized protein n=1 Tax=Peterkaempfera bronchialis TaxID=2126346 RepID=A0A345SVR9_9ACTN|nr:hypothetical protein C7M71_010625 [Peterkaempfera bronchialis]
MPPSPSSLPRDGAVIRLRVNDTSEITSASLWLSQAGLWYWPVDSLPGTKAPQIVCIFGQTGTTASGRSRLLAANRSPGKTIDDAFRLPELGRRRHGSQPDNGSAKTDEALLPWGLQAQTRWLIRPPIG